MHYVKVNVRRDELTEMAIHVATWEVPILEGKHGEERLTIGETVEFKTRPWPTDARSEFERLNRLYGVTGAGDNAMTFAERVYGTGSIGVKALERAIAEAREAAEGPAKKRGRPAKAADLVGDSASA